MKVRKVVLNNRKAQIELTSRAGKVYPFPYAQLDPRPSQTDRIKEIYVDRELDHDGVTYFLESGQEGSVLLEHALSYNRDPAYVASILLYKLTSEANARLDPSGLSRREIARKLGTSLSQLYRLLDASNDKKSAGQMIQLLHVLGADVDVVIKPRDAA